MEGMMQLAVAAFFAHLIEKVKDSDNPAFQWIGQNTETITKLLAGVVALLSAIGISFVWDPATGTATFSGIPTTVNAWAGIVTTWFTQYWLQKGYFLGILKPNKILKNVAEDVL